MFVPTRLLTRLLDWSSYLCFRAQPGPRMLKNLEKANPLHSFHLEP